MKTIYGDTPNKSIEDLKKYYYGSIIGLLYFKEDGYPLLDQRIQTLVNSLHGSLSIFNNDARVLSIISWLESARIDEKQFRKNVLDAANMIDQIQGGDVDGI